MSDAVSDGAAALRRDVFLDRVHRHPDVVLVDLRPQCAATEAEYEWRKTPSARGSILASGSVPAILLPLNLRPLRFLHCKRDLPVEEIREFNSLRLERFWIQ